MFEVYFIMNLKYIALCPYIKVCIGNISMRMYTWKQYGIKKFHTFDVFLLCAGGIKVHLGGMPCYDTPSHISKRDFISDYYILIKITCVTPPTKTTFESVNIWYPHIA